MSIFSDCRATVLVSDFAQADASGKLNMLGAGFALAGINPDGGMSAAQCLVVLLELPPRHYNEEFPIGVELRDSDTGSPVMVPSPAGPQTMRLQQLVRAEPVHLLGVYVPPSLWARVQVVVAFPMGLPGLRAGGNYEWKLEVEGQTRPTWVAPFHVLGPPPQPVLGGPTMPGPTDLPNNPFPPSVE